jgi:hypothetical protein
VGTFSSPLRDDGSPSFSIFPSRGVTRKLMFKDHALDRHGSCFDFVMLKYNLTFSEALQVINNDFNLNLDCTSSSGRSSVMKDFEYSKVEYAPVKVEFDIKYRPFSRSDLLFWAQFGIDERTLVKYNVRCAASYWMIRGDTKRFYRCIGSVNTTYCYLFPKESEIKLYRPFDKERKWFSNYSSSTVQGLEQLPANGKLLILTKALKDVMSLSTFNLYAVAPQTESIVLAPNTIQPLRDRFPVIFSLMDFDLAGVHAANKYRKLYGIEPFFLTNGRLKSPNYGSKDISDYIRDNGRMRTIQLLKDLGLTFV